MLRYWDDELAKPRNTDPKRLLRYGFKMYSQCDEDGIIQEIFRRIGAKHRTFIEFGVETGIECNSVKLLIEGWRGLWLDGSPGNIAQIRSRFDSFFREGRLQAIQSLVTAENINALIQQGGISGEIDLLSIDIDQNDYWVWQAIEVVKPRVVAIEYNATLRPPFSGVIPYNPTQAWDLSNYFACQPRGAGAARAAERIPPGGLQHQRRQRLLRARGLRRRSFSRPAHGRGAL